MLEGGEDAVLALDLVHGLADELAGGFLAQDERKGGVSDLVRGVGLAEAELGRVVRQVDGNVV